MNLRKDYKILLVQKLIKSKKKKRRKKIYANVCWNKIYLRFIFVVLVLISGLNSVNFETEYKAFCNVLTTWSLYRLIRNSIMVKWVKERKMQRQREILKGWGLHNRQENKLVMKMPEGSLKHNVLGWPYQPTSIELKSIWKTQN